MIEKWYRKPSDNSFHKTDFMTDYTLDLLPKFDTPQELVEVGDLVMIDNELLEVKKFNIEDSCIFGYKEIMTYRALQQITKILTPQGKDYICQWEVNK